jgi:hypothetical protein
VVVSPLILPTREYAGTENPSAMQAVFDFEESWATLIGETPTTQPGALFA